MTDLKREPSENPYVWGPRAAYRRDLQAISAELENVEDAVCDVETEIEEWIWPLEEKLEIGILPQQDRLRLANLHQVLSTTGSIRDGLRNFRIGPDEFSIRGQLETTQRANRLDLEAIDPGVDGLIRLVHQIRGKVSDGLNGLPLSERIVSDGFNGLPLSEGLFGSFGPFKDHDQYLYRAFTSWAESLRNHQVSGVASRFYNMLFDMEEASEWKRKDREIKRKKKEWEDEQLLTKLWPVS